MDGNSDSSQNTLLKKFFLETWKVNSFDEDLVREVNSLNPRSVLDVGCGNNLYKDRIHRLTGLDIVNPAADIICDILEFRGQLKFDIILCLGSLNFGGENEIIKRLQHVRSLLENNGRIYMRVNPGIRWAEQPDLEIFPWTYEKIFSIGDLCGLKLLGEITERQTPRGTRLRFTYIPKETP